MMMMTEEEFKAKLVENLREPINNACYASRSRGCGDCFVWKSCRSNTQCQLLPKELKEFPERYICPSKAFFQAYLEGKVALHNGEWVEVVDV